VNQVFAKLQAIQKRFQTLPPGIQQQLKTLADLQRQRRLGLNGRSGTEVDEAIKILSEDTGEKMIKLGKENVRFADVLHLTEEDKLTLE
jgi:hypothetical protein